MIISFTCRVLKT